MDSAKLLVDQRSEAAERLERLGADVIAVELDAEALLELVHELQHAHRVQLGQRPEQRRGGVERRRPLLDPERLDHGRPDGIEGRFGAHFHLILPIIERGHTSTSAGAGWLRNAVGLAVNPYAPAMNTTTRSPTPARGSAAPSASRSSGVHRQPTTLTVSVASASP